LKARRFRMENQDAEKAFLEQLERKRTEMMSQVRSKARSPARKRPPVLALAQNSSMGDRSPSYAQPVPIVDKGEQDQQELEMQWARSSALRVLQGGSSVENSSAISSVLPLRKVEDGFGRISMPGGTDPSFQRVLNHRIRKGTGLRVGLVLSCDGWGTKSDTLS